ncbi:MAG: HAMP domain-containing histidine kinase [Gammaproteobacteria bacterium]|nr:HAMP domain-containing histidine kinase [Gammaproteobacteria bacterium]
MKGFFRTTAFKVAAVYALVYAALTVAIVLVVYSLAENVIETQIRAGLVVESAAVSSLLADRGPEALEDVVRWRSEGDAPEGDHNPGGAERSSYIERIEEIEKSQWANSREDPGRRYYILATAEGQVVAGDVPAWPAAAPSSGWYRFHLDGHGDVLALVTPLENGMHFLVGQSLASTNALTKSVKLWAILSAALALLAGLIVGGAVGTRIMRSIREASAAAERIQSGHLGERLPLDGPSEQATLARTFNTMLDRIEVAVAGLRDLAARTAHEMKHPLARADQALARAEKTEERASAKADIAAARAEIGELANRINALLRLAQLESEAAHEYFSEFDLTALAEDVVDLYAPLVEEHGGSLRLVRTSPLVIDGDRQLIAQALANLLDNVLKYAPSETVEVRLGDASGNATLEVRDSGSGSGQTVRGSGLGLPIARAIAQLHGGRLELAKQEAGFAARLVLAKRAAPG